MNESGIFHCGTASAVDVTVTATATVCVCECVCVLLVLLKCVLWTYGVHKFSVECAWQAESRTNQLVCLTKFWVMGYEVLTSADVTYVDVVLVL